jgi:transcription factor IIIB subunit 2
VNVFELGHTYLQLVHTLNLRLPLVDPSHYISRFSALLEFGDDTHKVAHDAVRLVQRFDRDWMTKGRRPAGICGAALLLAARMNNFRRSIEEVVQVVKIADTTLKKRLEEFSRTSSAGLTVVDFRRVWLEEEMDPPAFTKGKEKEEEYSEEEEDSKGAKKKGKGNKKRRRVKLEQVDNQPDEGPPISGPSTRSVIDPSLFNEGILAGTLAPAPLDVPNEFDDITDKNIDPILLPSPSSHSNPPTTTTLIPQSITLFDETAEEILSEEVSTFLQNPQGAQLSQALAEAEERRLVQIQLNVVDEFTGLDEEELDKMILTEEEVKIKERVWVEMNRDYLEAIAGEVDRTSCLLNHQIDSIAAVKAERDTTGNVPTKTRKVCVCWSLKIDLSLTFVRT